MKHPVWQMLMGMCLLVITALLSWRAGELEPARQAGAGARERDVFWLRLTRATGERDRAR